MDTRENVDGQDPAEDKARSADRNVEEWSGYCQVTVCKDKHLASRARQLVISWKLVRISSPSILFPKDKSCREIPVR